MGKVDKPTNDDVHIIRKLLEWDKEYIFPSIDIVRSLNIAFPDIFTFDEKIQSVFNIFISLTFYF